MVSRGTRRNDGALAGTPRSIQKALGRAASGLVELRRALGGQVELRGVDPKGVNRDRAGEFVIFSVQEVYSGSVRVGLTVYAADGDVFDRYTDFVYENGTWRHSLTTEEYDLFDSAL